MFTSNYALTFYSFNIHNSQSYEIISLLTTFIANTFTSFQLNILCKTAEKKMHIQSLSVTTIHAV